MDGDSGPSCDPLDIAIKSFFVGPQAENGEWLKQQWSQILEHWLHWRQGLFPGDGRAISAGDLENIEFKLARAKVERAVLQIMRELEDETPKFTPRYLGHMVSEVSLPAMLGHVCALLHNPNNTSREVSKVTSRLEDEAIAELAAMVGLDPTAQGHFTSGGTLANFEALWRALVALDRGLSLYLKRLAAGEAVDFLRCVHSGAASGEADPRYSLLKLGPWRFSELFRKLAGREFAGPVILVPGNKHFSWEKAAVMMGLGDGAFWPVELDEWGRMNGLDLERKLEDAVTAQRPVALVVSVAGTTELGQVDPVDQIAGILENFRRTRGLCFWHHVDAAYGGYYCSLTRELAASAYLSPRTDAALRALGRSDSVTLDPHKLGYVPYACGAFIARDSQAYRTYSPPAPYLQAANSSRWASTIEGSRSGAGAAAVWLSNRAMGLDREGYGRLLEKGLQARERIQAELEKALPHILFATQPDLNIVCFCLARPGEPLTVTNARSLRIFEAFEKSPDFSISRTVLRGESYSRLIARLAQERALQRDAENMVMLRLVLMNPFILSKETNTSFVDDFILALSRLD